MNKWIFIASSASLLFCTGLYAETAVDAKAPSTSAPSTTTSSPALDAKPASPMAKAPSVDKIDCNYKLPSEKSTVEPAFVQQWAEQAAQQTFTFNSEMLDKQLADLKVCFTDQGWQSFNDALQKSGNLSAIKAQKLNLNSKITGNSNFMALKNNQWKVVLSLNVIYQNAKEKFNQALKVELLIGRKLNGDLGIMQIIASPESSTPDSTKPAVPNTPDTKPKA